MKKVNIGVVGLGFGKEFAAIYCDHPLVDKVAICTRNPETLKKAGEELGIPEELRFTNYDDMVSCEELDAIHIVTPIKEHYPQTIKALKAGKHTACTVPMATSLDELRDIVKTSKEVGKIYTMMETSLYTREYLYVKGIEREGRTWKDPVFKRRSYAEYVIGRLGRLLAGISAVLVWHTCIVTDFRFGRNNS